MLHHTGNIHQHVTPADTTSVSHHYNVPSAPQLRTVTNKPRSRKMESLLFRELDNKYIEVLSSTWYTSPGHYHHITSETRRAVSHIISTIISLPYRKHSRFSHLAIPPCSRTSDLRPSSHMLPHHCWERSLRTSVLHYASLSFTSLHTTSLSFTSFHTTSQRHRRRTASISGASLRRCLRSEDRFRAARIGTDSDRIRAGPARIACR